MDKQIDRYQLQSQLGRGGMATVYHAYDPRFKRYVAVKVLPREFLHDETFHSRFEREAMTIASLEHLAIVPVYDFGEYEGQPFLVMRYMPGGSLRDWIKRGPMSLAEVCHVIEQLAPALDKAHDQGVIHRDLKPGNILFDEDDNAYLSDFGIAKISEATAQLTGSGLVGTPAYMAPEFADTKELTAAVDIYALGVILYQMLTGAQPFQAATPLGILLAHVNQPIPDVRQSRPDLPEAMQYILEQALAKDPADRYPSAADLAADLSQVVRMHGDSESVPPQPVYEPLPEPAAPPSEALTMDGVEAVPQPRPAARARGQPVMLTWVILGVAVILLGGGGLALAGVFNKDQPATPEAEIAQQEPTTSIPTATISPPTTAPSQPTDVPPPTITFTPEPTRNPIYVLAETGVSSNGEWTPYIQEFDGVQMALVPAGCFMMGSDDRGSSSPAHQVCFDEPFWIDVYEVSNAQIGSSGVWSDDNLPREDIDWFESVDHCVSRGARLPTEAEWEYATRGPDGLVYPWGNTFDASLLNFCDSQCNYGWNNPDLTDGYKFTAPIDSFPGGVSWVGAYNLLGNVSEWVADWYGEDYYASLPDPVINPQGPESGDQRIRRGSGWGSTWGVVLFAPDETRFDAIGRYISVPDDSLNSFGLRCARSYEPPDAIPSDQPTPTAVPEPAEDPAISLAFTGVDTNSDWTPYIQDFDGVEMALVPAGCFMMGSEDGIYDYEGPIHEVCFNEPFWIDIYEVTNEQYGSAAQSDCLRYSSEGDQPRICIDWVDSVAYCESRGARLPTEAEWEYGARGPDGLNYPWGNDFIAENVVYDNTSNYQTDAVGSRVNGVSWVGVYDLSGNVWEWVNDWFGPNYYASSPTNDPQGPESGDLRVVRGGAWGDVTYPLESTFRFKLEPDYISYAGGFRCARSYGD